MAGKPYIPMYVGDWKKEPGIQLLSLEEKGAWLELLFWMNENIDRGQLSIRGAPLSMIHVSKILNCDVEKAEDILSKLIATETAGFDEEAGIVYSRRIKREAGISKTRSEVGRLGGLASRKQKGSKQEEDGEANTKQNGDIDTGNDTEVVTRKNKEQRLYRYTDGFELAWGIYPSRGDNSNPKRLASIQWEWRLKEGVPTAHLIQAVKAYVRECHGNHKYGTDKVMQAKTFFGPNARWEEYHEKYEKEYERAEAAMTPDPPARELTDEERAEGLRFIREGKKKLEDRRGKPNSNRDSGEV